MLIQDLFCFAKWIWPLISPRPLQRRVEIKAALYGCRLEFVSMTLDADVGESRESHPCPGLQHAGDRCHNVRDPFPSEPG